MKSFIVLLLVTLIYMGQVSAQKEKYNLHPPPLIISFVTDCSISKQNLYNGIELSFSDSEYVVISFDLSYECSDSIYHIRCNGSKVDTTSALFRTSAKEISVGTLLIIDNITVLDSWYRTRRLPSKYFTVSD
jgi:hypothetical protein